MSVTKVTNPASPGMDCWRNGNNDATYVQAWLCTGPDFEGFVYVASVMLDKMGLGCDVVAGTFVRHDDGRQSEWVRGTIASDVAAYRESL